MTAVADAGGTAATWRPPLQRALLAAFPLFVTIEVVVLWTPWRQKALVGGMAALTLASPASGLLALCVLTPLGTLIEWITNLPYRISESLVVAFLGAWLVRAASDRWGPRMPRAMGAAGWLLAVAVFASVAGNAWHARVNPEQLAGVVAWLRQAYYVTPDSIGFLDAARIVEMLGLTAATFRLFRQQPSLASRLPAALAAGGAVAAAAAVIVWSGIGPATLVGRFSRFGYRAAHIGDVNAAGSYFGLLLCVAGGMAWRARGGRRASWVALVAAIAVGLWFAESKSAIAAVAVAVVLAGGWLMTTRWSSGARVALLAALVVAGAAASAVRAHRLEQDPTFLGSGFRSQFYEASLRMIAARPLSGVGVGQYFITSELFLSPELSFAYGHENAHNYFLQLGAELGIPGLIVFAVWIISGLVPVARFAWRDADPRLVGMLAGLGAFLATCTTGHPLLVDEVAYPFAILLAIAVAVARSAELNAAASPPPVPQPAPAIVAFLAGAIVVCTVIGVRTPVVPLSSPGVDGFYAWQSTSGVRFRWTQQFASIFVPADVRRVSIPIRLPGDVHRVAPIGVEVAHGGVTQQRVVVGGTWVMLDVPLPDGTPLPAKRIDLRVDRTWQPAIYIAGSGDLRPVGVQVGQWKALE